MAGKNLSPRQQMIGLMYLVLLAMLAMNASKDLLNAFILLDNGINITNQNLQAGNQVVFDKIQSSAALGSDKAVKALKNAQFIQSSARDLLTTIKQYKKELIELGGGINEETGIPLGKDNQDVGAEYLLVSKKGAALKEKIELYKTTLINMIQKNDTGLITSISQILATPEHVDYENNKSSWESGISEHLPLVAVTANLSNIETYVQNAQTQVLGYLHEGIALDTYKVNKILATSISQKSYVLQGEEYKAQVFLAAADTTQEPLILIGAYDTSLYKRSGKVNFFGKVDSLPVHGGIGDYQIKTNETGRQTWGGIMKVPHPNPKRKGEYLSYPFKSEYTVAAPSAVISSEQLNLMYLGLNNEIAVSAPGMTADEIRVTATNRCSVSPMGNGKYKFKPSRTGTIAIQVARKSDGKIIASQNWTGKRLPKPRLTLLKKELKPLMTKNKFKVPGNKKFETSYSPDFPLSGKLTIEKCLVSFEVNGNWSTATNYERGIFNTDFQRKLQAQRRGDRIEITMKVRGQDGIPHDLPYTVKIR